MNRFTLAVALVTAATLAGPADAQPAAAVGTDPILGVWQLNVERSVWSPGPRPPADARTIRQYSSLGNGWMQFTTSSLNEAGNLTFQIGVFKLDGQRYPVHTVATLGAEMTSGQPSNMTRAYRVVDPRTTESITYTDGVAGNPLVRAVSSDGMSFVETNRGTNAQGQAIQNVLVWDRIR